MQRFIGIITFVFLVFCSTAQTSSATAQVKINEISSPTPTMIFETTDVDYGVIQQNSEPYREFHFTNEGNAPLVISNAKGSCGCTVPEWSKEPIAPGESSLIKVRYATNRIGKFSKTVTLKTNEVEGKHVLRIKGEVLQPGTEEDTPASATNK